MKVVVCMKDTLLRDALEKLLSTEGGYDVVAGAGKVDTAFSAARVHGARVVVTVLDGLESDDIDLLKEYKESISSLLLMIAGEEEDVEKAGISFDKFVPKHGNKQRLFRHLNELATKEMRPRHRVAERRPMYGTANVLTQREQEIALKVAEGFTNRDIAYDLNLAEQTVKNMVSVVMRKMGCSNRVQVALKLSKNSEN